MTEGTWQDLFDNAKPEDVEFKAIPKGEYVAVVSNGELDETKAPPVVSIQYQLLEGDFEGRKITQFYRMEKKGPYFLKKDFEVLGYTGPTSDKIPYLLESIQGRKCKIYIKPREFEGKTYYNVYANELVTDVVPNQGIDNNEEIPF